MTPISIETLSEQIKVLSFDQYGTVVDMQGGLVEFVTPFLRDKGWSGRPDQFVTWWRRTHFENSMIDALCDRGHTPYREIGRRAVSYTLERAGIRFSDDEALDLVAAIERLRPFPEVPAALARLATRYRLAIFSNGDNDMLEAAKPYLGHCFDHTISVQQAGCYKPHRRSYATAARLLDVAPHEVLHVANHAFDCIGATAAGMHAAFIDRRGRPYGRTPHSASITVTSMTALADLLLA